MHIHTDKSNETKDNDYPGKFSIETLVGKLKDEGVKLISLTDHNILNCEAYENLENEEIKFLVGVEFDIAISKEELTEYIKERKNSSGEQIKIKPFHVLVLFSSKDFNDLSIKLEKMYKKITTECLKEVADLAIEKKLRVTTIEYLVRSFKEEDFFLIAHGNKDKGIVKPYQKANKIEDAQTEILLGGISALEMKSNANIEQVIRRYEEGFSKLIKEDFQAPKTTSYVVFSDNHDCDNYEIGDFQTWIKGIPCYETLRIAFSDPDSRIHTSINEPKQITNYIEEFNIMLKNNEVQKILLSPQLNVIIGGRSSGKRTCFKKT